MYFFFIGDVEPFRHEPDRTAVELSVKRRLDASMRYLDRRYPEGVRALRRVLSRVSVLCLQ